MRDGRWLESDSCSTFKYYARLWQIEVGEEWIVDAFLCGIQHEQSAASVRGHYPQTLDETVRIAVFQVDEYGEGYRIGLKAAIGKQA